MLKRTTFAVLACLGASYVIAAPQPQAFDFAGGKLIPMMGVAFRQDSNIFRQSANEESDTITEFKPVVQLLGEKDANRYALTYTGDYAKYWDSSRDDYADHTISADVLLSPNNYYSVDFGASLGKLHENRGEGSSEGINAIQRPEPDEYDLNNINVVFDFGRDSARMGVELEAARSDIEYTNNRSETQFRDRDETNFGGRVYVRTSGKTRVFVGAARKDFEYDVNPLFGGTLDSEQQRWYVGARWEVTGKTSGEVRIGSVDKDFDEVTRTDSDLGFWNAAVTWSPRTYSQMP